MEKEDFKVGVRFTGLAWGKETFVDIKFIDKVGLYGVDENGATYSMGFDRVDLSTYSIIPEKKKVWLDGDDLPDVFKVRFEGDETKYLTCRTQSASFALRRGVGGEFEYFYNSHKYELETAEWSPITENNWQKFYKYE